MKKAVIWGASGHARVLKPIIELAGYNIIAMFDQNPQVQSFIPGCPVLSSLEVLLQQLALHGSEEISFAIAIGGDKGKDRLEMHKNLTSEGLSPLKLVHSKAWVAETAQLGDGAQVLGMAAVSEEAKIGRQSIINTNASIDHEVEIGEGCHIMPGATVAGCVVMEDFCTIGSNATIFPRVRIGGGAIIGAGSVVTKDVPQNAVVIGAPARVRRTQQ